MKPLVVQLDPAKLPSAQHKGIARTGHVYTKPAVVRAVRAIVCLIREEHAKRLKAHESDYGQEGKAGKPWAVAIEYVYSLKTAPKRMGGLPKATRPDLDNITKLVLDAMVEAGCFFEDDGQVVSLATLKRHAHADPELGEPAHIIVSARPIYDHELVLFGHHWRNDNESRD